MSLLSKTRYLQHLQCPKLLWISVHNPELIPPPSKSDEHRMTEGKKVEALARQMFDGSLVDHDGGLDSVVEESEEALDCCETGDCVFRPVMKAGELVAEMDIVCFSRGGRYDIHDVKVSASVKDELHLRSWFRDQVCHPHETQHRLSEILPIFKEEGLDLRRCSLNNFAPIESLPDLLALEAKQEERGREALAAARFIPGFFLFLAEKRGS